MPDFGVNAQRSEKQYKPRFVLQICFQIYHNSGPTSQYQFTASVTCLLAVTKCLLRSSLWTERFILDHSSKVIVHCGREAVVTRA